MTTPKNIPATATGKAEPRLQRPSAQERNMQDALIHLHHQQAYVLGPVLAALERLADSQRVLSDFEAVANHDEAFGAGLNRACPSWRNPLGTTDEDGSLAVIADLARAACYLANNVGERIDALAWGRDGGAK